MTRVGAGQTHVDDSATHSVPAGEPKMLGPYRLEHRLGAGGMGEVYRGTDTRLHRTVAVKLLRGLADEKSRKRFEREAQAASALNHPHICTLHDVGSHDGVEFLVMEYLEGQTLADRLARGPMKADEALRVATQYPEQFGYFAVWSMGVGNDFADWQKRTEAFLSRGAELNKSIKLFSVRVGDKDFLLASAKNLDMILTKAGIEHEFKISGGGHTWINWRQYLNELGPKLFQ